MLMQTHTHIDCVMWSHISLFSSSGMRRTHRVCRTLRREVKVHPAQQRTGGFIYTHWKAEFHFINYTASKLKANYCKWILINSRACRFLMLSSTSRDNVIVFSKAQIFWQKKKTCWVNSVFSMPKSMFTLVKKSSSWTSDAVKVLPG